MLYDQLLLRDSHILSHLAEVGDTYPPARW